MGRRNRSSGSTPRWLLMIEMVVGLGGIWVLYLVATNALKVFIGGL